MTFCLVISPNSCHCNITQRVASVQINLISCWTLHAWQAFEREEEGENLIAEKKRNKVILYSLTSPYGHLDNKDGHPSITDSSFGPRNAKYHTFPTSIIRTPL